MKGRSRLYPISIIMMAAFLAAGPANAVYAAEPNGSWVNLDGNWYWKKTDGTAYIGWLYTGGEAFDEATAEYEDAQAQITAYVENILGEDEVSGLPSDDSQGHRMGKGGR